MAFTHGLGAIQSPPDHRDLIATHDKLLKVTAPAPLPDAFILRVRPPILNQGTTPQCVAYSSAAEKSHADRNDFGRFIRFNEQKFFWKIGGTAAGAVMRYAIEEMRRSGYPEAGSNPQPWKHKIAGYALVEHTQAAVKRAIQTVGGVLIVGPWWSNWEYPIGDQATLPPPSGTQSGHAWWAVGWNDGGVIGQQSWGKYWGNDGLFRMPWYYVLQFMWEIWITPDIETLKLIKDQ